VENVLMGKRCKPEEVKQIPALRPLHVADAHVICGMNTEEFTQSELESEELRFDAHEFDGLRDELTGAAQTWLRRADEFIRDNPWLCVAIAAGVGCAVACALRSGSTGEEQEVA
jgi:hypothetical protein